MKTEIMKIADKYKQKFRNNALTAVFILAMIMCLVFLLLALIAAISFDSKILLSLRE